jgi:hypothetical protein
MASSEDTEITLGTGKLLVLFFGLVGVCALFFALGPPALLLRRYPRMGRRAAHRQPTLPHR